MNPAKRYWLCNDCAAEGEKVYDLYLTYWRRGAKDICDRCKKEAYGAEYRLVEKGYREPFHIGAYVYGKDGKK